MSRRSFLGGSASLLSATLLPLEAFGAHAAGTPVHATATTASLDQFARTYMDTMHAPGMTVALVSGDQLSSRVYGYGNTDSKTPVSVEQPFWIGSICKSFVGLIAMQLRDEGKLDLHKPVLEIMPDLPFRNDFGPITAHHLLTHTSGLPNWLRLFSSDAAQEAKQAYAPGNHFAYCNLGYDTLGLLIAHLDGRSWPEAVTARILKPLGMTGASGQIDYATQTRMPTGYHFQYRDRPCAVSDPMVPVGYVMMGNAAGSIAATADDMTKYMRMLLRSGGTDGGRIVSEESFRLFSTPYIKAPVLGPNASYGYGIGVETIDGRKMLRHTGGATAFASSIFVDLDGGVAAFASINSMQEYRPNPVTMFAVDLLYAEKSGHDLPDPPSVENPLACKQPREFTGRYTATNGDVLTVTGQADVLTIASARGSTQLRPIGVDTFSAADGSVLGDSDTTHAPSEFALLFGRGGQKSGSSAAVTDLSYGPRWYAAEHYQGTPDHAKVERAERYIGIYCTDSPWSAPFRIVERNGKLWLDGTDELHSLRAERFSIVGDEGVIELEFASFLQGRAQAIRTLGDVLRRVNVIAAS